MIRAVLDANVFVSALLRPEGPPGRILTRLIRDDAFRLVVSPPIFQELERALSYRKIRKFLNTGAEEQAHWIASLAVIADVVEPRRRIHAVSADPSDNIYLEAAVEGRAEVLVSGDRHLLDLQEFEGIRILNPRSFLVFL